VLESSGLVCSDSERKYDIVEFIIEYLKGFDRVKQENI
jgi:hypothetical protein